MSNPATDTAPFDAHLEQWAAYLRTPWARVRYDVVADVLDRRIAELGPGTGAALRVLDLGGGDGSDSLRLAASGHHVTIVDPSPGMLTRARGATTEAGLEDRVRLVQADADQLATLDLESFDVALCHFLLQYVDDPVGLVSATVRALRPGGLVSVMAPNPASDVLFGLVRNSDPVAALSVLDAETTTTATFDADVARVEAMTVTGWLIDAGCTVLARYGVRCAVDLIRDEGCQHDPAAYADILALELALHDRSPFRDVARAWQLVAVAGHAAGGA